MELRVHPHTVLTIANIHSEVQVNYVFLVVYYTCRWYCRKIICMCISRWVLLVYRAGKRYYTLIIIHLVYNTCNYIIVISLQFTMVNVHKKTREKVNPLMLEPQKLTIYYASQKKQ